MLTNQSILPNNYEEALFIILLEHTKKLWGLLNIEREIVSQYLALMGNYLILSSVIECKC